MPKSSPFLGEGQSGVRAFEEFETKFVFHLANLVADGPFGLVELLRGRGKARQAHDRLECTKGRKGKVDDHISQPNETHYGNQIAGISSEKLD